MPFLGGVGDWIANDLAKWITGNSTSVTGNYAKFGPKLEGQKVKRGINPRNIIAEVQRQSGQRPKPPGDGFPSMADIFSRLEELQNPSRYMGNMGDLDAQAQAQVSAQYDPLIAALRNQMGAAQGRAGRNKEQLGQMYTALSSSLQGDVPELQQMYADTKQQSQGNYDNLQKDIQGQYANSQSEQEAMWKRLNIEAAAPELSQRQMTDRDFFMNRAKADAQTQQSAIGQEERGAVNYTQQGSQIARSEGVNRQADLMSQLEELLQTYEGQIGAHEAAKQSAFYATRGDLQSQMQDRAGKQAQQDFHNYLDSIGMGRQLRNDELGQIAKGQTNSVKSAADIPGRAMTLGLPESSAMNIQDAVAEALGSNETILSGMDPASGMALTPEAKANQMVEQARQRGLSQQELNALRIIALEYFGRS